MKIFTVIPKTYAGCGFYRQWQPHNRLAKTHDVEMVFGAGVYDQDLEFAVDADIIQFHKGYFDMEGIKAAKERGIVTIADFDDWWNLDSEHLFYNNYRKDGTVKQLTDLLRAVDYVTCTTELLADEVRRYNTNVIVLPNAMDMDYPNCQKGRVKEEKIIFAYLGGSCHGKDVSQLHGLNNRLSSYKNYKFRLMGMDGTKVYNHYASVLSDGGRLSKTHFDWTENANIWNYPLFYNYLDVSLVPLMGNKFNSMKSELKLIEAGFFKKAVIVDNVEPYKGLLKHKQNALIVNKRNDWYKNCKYLLDNPEAIKDLGEALHETVQPYHVDEVNKKRYKFYSDVLERSDTNSSNRHSRLSVVHE